MTLTIYSAFHYCFVETGKKLDKSRKYLLKLSLYWTDVPLCCCYNNESTNCMNLMFERMKYLFTEWQVYKYIIYHVLIRPIVAFSTFWISFIVVCNVALVGTPISYLVDNTSFKRNQISPTWWAYDGRCDWVPQEGTAMKGLHCTADDHVWVLNSFADTLAFGLLCLIVLPITLRINNWFAEFNKYVAYLFYTFYYSNNQALVNDKQPMI